MNQRERMLSGLPYKAWLDGLEEDRQACKQKIYDFNQLPPSRQSKEAPQMIKNILGKTGESVWVEAPFHCDYGWNIEVGENFYANYNLTILDVGKVTLGKMFRLRRMFPSTQQVIRFIRTAVIPDTNMEFLLRLETMYGLVETQ